MSKTNIALVGFGVIGRKHRLALLNSQTAHLAAIVDPDPAAHAFAKSQAIPAFNDLDGLFAGDAVTGGIDGVILATPNDLHAAQALRCIERGLPVLIEKPICTTLAEARLVVNAADGAKIPVLVGHYRRFNSQMGRARDLLHTGRIGKLVGLSAIWSMKKHDAYYDADWRCRRPGGGPVLINLIHDIDCLRWLCGEIVAVSAHLSHQTRNLAVEDSAAITVRFESGALGSIMASDAAPSPWAFEATTGENPDFAHMDESCYRFTGTEGALDFPLLRLWTYPDPDEGAWDKPMIRTHYPSGPGRPLTAQIDHFARVIRGEEPPRTTARDGARTLSATLAISTAATSGQTVEPEAV